MDFDSAVKTINRLLINKQPYTFNSSWIRGYAPRIYRFIQKNIRREIGGIDWDRVTRALDYKFGRRWITSRLNGTKPYRSKAEVNIILSKYDGKLYTFLTPADKNDKYIRDIISIALVRIAQKGNILARQEIIKLVTFTIEGCVRCYRYSGSFIGYLFKTLEYAGRGLRPIVAYSLDDPLYPGQEKKKR
jgi:hypothetical protein